MDKPTEDQIRQRAHELWEQSHRPDGRDDEFWNQAERELQEAEDRGNPAKEIPDDKNVIERLADKINDAVENIVSTTADALDHAMQPEPLKPGEEAITFMRMAGDGFVSDPLTPPLEIMPVMAPKKKRPAKKKSAAKKSAKKSTKKVAKRPAKKTKSSAGLKAVGKKKTTKKVTKKKKAKKAKKSKR
jgi:hypothetical protein